MKKIYVKDVNKLLKKNGYESFWVEKRTNSKELMLHISSEHIKNDLIDIFHNDGIFIHRTNRESKYGAKYELIAYENNEELD